MSAALEASSTGTALLRLHRISLLIGGHPLVNDISLDFAGSGLTALVGPNGAGKSTLLGIAAGDTLPTSGEVSLAGKPMAAWRARALARERAVMPQDHAVRFAFSVAEVVAMGRLPHTPDPVKDEAIVEQALAASDITRLADRNVQTLSGGESARTAFSRVLTQQTRLILLDEPTAALDMHHQETTLRRLRELADAGACIIVVLHDLNLAAAYADRIVMLESGRVVADGAPREVLTEEIISRVYRQSVHIIEHPTRGIPLVVVTG
ncbi:heme ABC transporter ATP-binding protein [Luteimonas sp. RIT-PG2_3]